MTEDDREEGEGFGVDESGAPLIERGATVEGDEEALAAAANTSLDMDGFETGAGFDLDDLPDDLGGDVEIEALEILSSADELALDEAVTPSSVGVGGADPAVDVADLRPVEPTDAGPLEVPTEEELLPELPAEGLPELPTPEGLPALPASDELPELPAEAAPPAPPANVAPPVPPADAAPPALPAAPAAPTPPAEPLQELPADTASPAPPADAGPLPVPSDVPVEPGAGETPSRVERSGEASPKAGLSGFERLERQKRRSDGRRIFTAVAAVLLLVAGAAATMGYLGVLQIPGITPLNLSRFEVAAPVVLPGPQPESPVMSHVVVVDVWREAETPLAWAEALREGMPDVLGFVNPLSIDGERRYALAVGPAYSVAQANYLKGPLEQAFALLDPDPDRWTVREVPYSFFFGEYPGLGPANARVQELSHLSVSAFVLEVAYADGAAAFRVYGGAFADEVEALGMGQLLNEQGLGDTPLTERRGLLPE